MYTDEFSAYDGLPAEYAREIVNHLQDYVCGRVHTQGIENFWSLLKRSLNGTYVSVDPAHLQAYLDEQCCRFNNRTITDSERFSMAVSGIVGKRITYRALIGKEGETAGQGKRIR